MKAFTSIFRKGRRSAPESTRKRPARSFASTFAPLEGRALLSLMGPAPVAAPPLSTTTAALIESIAIPRTLPRLARAIEAPPAADPTAPPGPGGASRAAPAAPDGQAIPVGQIVDHLDHVDVEAAPVVVDGHPTLEVALADFDASKVIVRLGLDGRKVELGPSEGIDHPVSVKLADLNNDDIPDLIVANTNGNNVLIFPGLGDGRFGPEIDGGGGIAVGLDPVSVTVDLAKSELIVTNAESNSVTILGVQVVDGAWTASTVGTIATPLLPTMTLLNPDPAKGQPDLLVCNTGADEVTVYQGEGDGSFQATPSLTFPVGSAPEAMLVGDFDKRLQADLITVNTGSDDLTYVSDAFGPRPVTRTISSGGTSPDAAFAIDPGHTGVMDLVVANGGDGRMAVFRGGTEGLQLAGVITQASVPAPTALAPTSSGGDGLDFFAASAGDDSALLLHFDLGVASTYLPGASGESGGIGQGDGELIAQLTPFDGSSLELIAVLWAGSPDSEATSAASNLREPSTITALYSPTEGQGGEGPGPSPEASSGPRAVPPGPVAPPDVDPSPLYRFVSGLAAALDRPAGYVEAIAARDVPDEGGDRPLEGFASLDPDRREADRPFDADLEAAPGVLGGGAIRLFEPEGTTGDGAAPADPRRGPGPIPGLDEADAPALEVRLEAVPLISTAVLASTRLIIKVAPPRAPAPRGPSRLRRFVSPGHDRRAGDRPDPL